MLTHAPLPGERHLPTLLRVASSSSQASLAGSSFGLASGLLCLSSPAPAAAAAELRHRHRAPWVPAASGHRALQATQPGWGRELSLGGPELPSIWSILGPEHPQHLEHLEHPRLFPGPEGQSTPASRACQAFLVSRASPASRSSIQGHPSAEGFAGMRKCLAVSNEEGNLGTADQLLGTSLCPGCQ